MKLKLSSKKKNKNRKKKIKYYNAKKEKNRPASEKTIKREKCTTTHKAQKKKNTKIIKN